jgi:predicted kinase
MHAIITVGISASGKTTWAESQVGFTNINLDDIRFETFCNGIRDWSLYSFKNDPEVVRIRDQKIVDAAFRKENIIISDTNLNKQRTHALARKLAALGYTVELKVFDTPLKECLERNAKRKNPVASTVILDQYARFEGVDYNV